MTLIHTDTRGRVSLGKLLEANRDYRVTTSPHGTVVLEPVTTITDYERAVLSRPELVEALDRNLAALDRGEGVFRERRQR
jgi:hypothetical protein